MWLAAIPRPALPLSEIHKAIWGYYPEAADGDPRPFIWRPLEDGRLGVLSRLQPACPAVLIRPESGRVYAFEALLKTEANRGRQTQGEGRASSPGRRVERADNAERKVWLARNVGGAEITFVQFFDRPAMRFMRSGEHPVTIPVAVARGTVHVTERAAFTDFLCRGGPGTGKVYGCGMWWLPELMEPALRDLGNARCAA